MIVMAGLKWAPLTAPATTTITVMAKPKAMLSWNSPVGARRERRGDGHQADRGQQEHGAELGQRPFPQG
jgi:hypothetical protein